MEALRRCGVRPSRHDRSCTFLTRRGERLAGFASYDPRQDRTSPGRTQRVVPNSSDKDRTAQIREVLRRLGVMGIARARVTTLDLPFFTAAHRTYIRCGFTEMRRTPWDRNPTTAVVEYERTLSR